MSFRPQHFAIGGLLNFVLNTLIMWLVVNHLVDIREKVSLARCAICAILLYVVSCAAIALLLFPTPLIFILSAVVWLVGSVVVIRSVFELTHQGGGAILFLYLLLLVTTHGLAKEFGG